MLWSELDSFFREGVYSIFFCLFLVQQDIYDGDVIVIDSKEDDLIHGNFEVVPGVSADDYIKRFKEYEITVSPDGRKQTIRIPPPPEDYYDLEWDNNEWEPVPKDLLEQMMVAKRRLKKGEITERQCDLIHCKLIVEELNKYKVDRKHQRRPSVISGSSVQTANENVEGNEQSVNDNEENDQATNDNVEENEVSEASALIEKADEVQPSTSQDAQ